MNKNARYPIASITSKDIEVLTRRDLVKQKHNVTDEDIYIAGLESLEKLEK
jgi:hypothetical protein